MLKNLIRLVCISMSTSCVVTMVLISISKINNIDKLLWCFGLLCLELFFMFVYDDTKN